MAFKKPSFFARLTGSGDDEYFEDPKAERAVFEGEGEERVIFEPPLAYRHAFAHQFRSVRFLSLINDRFVHPLEYKPSMRREWDYSPYKVAWRYG